MSSSLVAIAAFQDLDIIEVYRFYIDSKILPICRNPTNHESFHLLNSSRPL